MILRFTDSVGTMNQKLLSTNNFNSHSQTSWRYQFALRCIPLYWVPNQLTVHGRLYGHNPIDTRIYIHPVETGGATPAAAATEAPVAAAPPPVATPVAVAAAATVIFFAVG